ncbi:MAG: hypothetical protein ABI082_12505 [Dokdonella sp.]
MKKHLLSAVVAGLCLSSLATAGDGENRKIDLVNKTHSKIIELYASAPSTKAWEENIIKGQTVDPGETMEIDLDDESGNCKFDFKAVLAGGGEATLGGFDVCVGEKLTITE